MLNKSQTLETKRYMMRAIANLAVNGKTLVHTSTHEIPYINMVVRA
jgi:hypothetical protein